MCVSLQLSTKKIDLKTENPFFDCINRLYYFTITINTTIKYFPKIISVDVCVLFCSSSRNYFSPAVTINHDFECFSLLVFSCSKVHTANSASKRKLWGDKLHSFRMWMRIKFAMCACCFCTKRQKFASCECVYTWIVW